MYAEGQIVTFKASDTCLIHTKFGCPEVITATVVGETEFDTTFKISDEDWAKVDEKAKAVKAAKQYFDIPKNPLSVGYYPNWIEIEPTPAEPEAAPVSPVAVARSANEMADDWGNEKLIKMYTEMLDQDKRIERARKWLTSTKAKGYSDAQAQLIAFTLLERVNSAGTGNRWMGGFTEKIHEQLVNKLSSFGAEAYPLTDKQFDAAVKAAW